MQPKVQAFIRLENQESTLARIAREDMVYLAHLNKQLKEQKPGLVFDYERENEMGTTEAWLHLGAHATVEECQQFIKERISVFKQQPLVRYQPDRLMIFNDVVGVICDVVGNVNIITRENYYLPRSVKVNSLNFCLDTLPIDLEQRAAMIEKTGIIAFIAQPFDN